MGRPPIVPVGDVEGTVGPSVWSLGANQVSLARSTSPTWRA